jgi:hypothetical protein
VDDYDSLVEQLALKEQAQAARQALIDAGPAATAAVRRGLRHDDPVVRARCCMVLDHHLDEAAIPG